MSVAENQVDPWGMAFVHKIYRRELRLLPGLIRGVTDGDRDRAAVVAQRLTDVTAALNHHHVSEDELLWPVLQGRAGVPAELVHRMEQQHAALHELLTSIAELAPRWRADATAAARDALADTVARTSAVTDEHLADEEEHVVPLIARYLTEAEWGAFERRGEEFLGAEGLEKAFLWFGLGLQDATVKEAGNFLGGMPQEVITAWEGTGKRAFVEQQDRLLGVA